MRKLRLGKIPQLAQSHKTSKWLSCGSIPGWSVWVWVLFTYPIPSGLIDFQDLPNTIRLHRSPGLTQHHQASLIPRKEKEQEANMRVTQEKFKNQRKMTERRQRGGAFWRCWRRPEWRKLSVKFMRISVVPAVTHAQATVTWEALRTGPVNLI